MKTQMTKNDFKKIEESSTLKKAIRRRFCEGGKIKYGMVCCYMLLLSFSRKRIIMMNSDLSSQNKIKSKLYDG